MKYMKLMAALMSFGMAISSLAQAPNKSERHKQILEEFDVDKDGRISKEEHEKVKEAMQKQRDGKQGGSKQKPPISRLDSTILKAEVIKFPSALSQKIKTLRPEYAFFSQVKKLGNKKHPLVIYLHGGGGQGGSTSKHLNNVMAKQVSQYKHPFAVLVPVFQKAEGMPNGWDPDDLTTLLKHVITKHDIDPDRVYLTGHSMGGAGSFMWANQYPQLFAGIAPTSAGGAESPKGDLPVKAVNFKGLPIWAFHGSEDGACDYRKIESLLKQVNTVGGNAKFTILEGEKHNIGGIINEDDKILRWFLEH